MGMAEFKLKVKWHKDYIIFVLNNSSEENDVLSDTLENHLISSDYNELMKEMILGKLNNRYEKIKEKSGEKKWNDKHFFHIESV